MINSFQTVFETRERKNQQERLFAGESADLVASLTRDGVPLSLTGCTVRGIYQPASKRGTGEFYAVPAEIVEDRVVVHWSADREGGGNTRYWVWGLVEGAGGVAYPCSWILDVAYSPSYPVGELPDPIPETLDFSKYNLLNDPWLRVTHLAGGDEVPQDVNFTGDVTMEGDVTMGSVSVGGTDLKAALDGIKADTANTRTNADYLVDAVDGVMTSIGEPTGEWRGYTVFEFLQGAIGDEIETRSMIGTDPEGENRSVQVALNDARVELVEYFDDIAARIGTPPSSRSLVSMIGDVTDSCMDIDSTTRGTGAKIDNQTYGLAAIRAAIDALAAALPSQASVVPYVTDNTLTLRLGTVVYRMNPTGTSISIPSPVTTALPATDGYYQFEIELAVPATATSLTAPSGWTWLSGYELPSSGYAGKTVFVSCRMDLRGNAVTASCWRVA